MDRDLTRFGGWIEEIDDKIHIIVPMKSNMDTRITDIGSAIVRNDNRIIFGGQKLYHLDNYMEVDRPNSIFRLHIVCIRREKEEYA